MDIVRTNENSTPGAEEKLPMSVEKKDALSSKNKLKNISTSVKKF